MSADWHPPICSSRVTTNFGKRVLAGSNHQGIWCWQRMFLTESDMGAWGTGIFENDTACDFAATIAEGNGLVGLEQALDRVLESETNYLEAPDAEEGLAAADIVARLKGSPGAQTSYTALIDAWVERSKSTPSEHVIEKARRSIIRILAEHSELLELWQDSTEFEIWKHNVEEVARRL